MNAIEEVLVALVILQGLGIVVYAFLNFRSRKRSEKLNRIKADVLKSKWVEAVSRESIDSTPVMDVLKQKSKTGGIRPLNLSVSGINPDIQKVPADWPLL